MWKINLEEDQLVDYIYCLSYYDSGAIQTNFQPLEVTGTSVSCNLLQRQRSSQQILDLADYLHMHSSSPIRHYNCPKSFSSDIPLWIQLPNPQSLFHYLTDEFESNDDVMLLHYRTNLNQIEEFCREQGWRCTDCYNVRGSEASVTILYDLDSLAYEFLTRAKTPLIIVTIEENQRYILSL